MIAGRSFKVGAIVKYLYLHLAEHLASAKFTPLSRSL